MNYSINFLFIRRYLQQNIHTIIYSEQDGFLFENHKFLSPQDTLDVLQNI